MSASQGLSFAWFSVPTQALGSAGDAVAPTLPECGKRPGNHIALDPQCSDRCQVILRTDGEVEQESCVDEVVSTCPLTQSVPYPDNLMPRAGMRHACTTLANAYHERVRWTSVVLDEACARTRA